MLTYVPLNQHTPMVAKKAIVFLLIAGLPLIIGLGDSWLVSKAFEGLALASDGRYRVGCNSF